MRISVGGLAMNAKVAGAPGDPLVVLLHGFPELAESWDDILPALAAVGFHAVAPDLRGYGETDCPPHGYDLDTLSLDVVALIRALGYPRAHLVGHDWGGGIAYHVAAHHPEVVDRLVVINCPHPEVMRRRLLHPAQLVRSWYMFFFQLPWLPEYLMRRRGGSLAARMMRAAAVDKTRFTRERLAPYAAQFTRPGRARAALAYYRSAFRQGLFGVRRYPKIRAPFRLIWGERDVALRLHLTQGLEPYFERPVEVCTLPEVGHFVPIEAPGPAAALIVEHLRRPPAGPKAG